MVGRLLVTSWSQSLVFFVMVGRLLVGFVCLNLQFSVSWLVDFQWASCVSIFSFLCHGWQTFSGVRVAQSLLFCVMVLAFRGVRVLNLQFSVSWWQTFSGVRVAHLQFSVSCLVFVWLFFSFLCHGWQTFSGVRMAQSLVLCFMVGRLLVSCGSMFSFLCHGRLTFSGVPVSLVFCVMVGRLLVVVCLNLQFSVSWLVDFQFSCAQSLVFCVMVQTFSGLRVAEFRFLCHGRQTFSGVRVVQSLVFCVMVGRLLVGFVWFNVQFSVSWQVDFQGVRVAQSLLFCVMVGRLFVGFVWLNLQFSASWLVDFQWGRVAQSLVFSVMVVQFQWGSCGSSLVFSVMVVQTFSVRFNLQFFVSWLVDFQCWLLNLQFSVSWLFSFSVSGCFVWRNLQFSVSWQVDFQWGSVWLNLQFSVSWLVDFQCHFVWLNLQFSVSWLFSFSGVRCQCQVVQFSVSGCLVFSVRLNLQFSVSCCLVFSVRVQFSVSCRLVFSVRLFSFQWGSCGSMFSFLRHGSQIFSVRGLNLQFSVSWLEDFQWGSCSIFCFLCHGWQTFSGLRVSQSLVFCVMVGRLLVGFVWLNLQFSVSWLVDFQWGSCGSIFSFPCPGRQTFRGFVWLNLYFSVSWLVDYSWGSYGSIFCFLRHGRQTFSGVRVAQSLVFSVMVGRLLVGFVWLYLQFSVSWLVDFQWGSCGSIFSFVFHGLQTFSGVCVAQSLVFCFMVGRLLVGFVCLNLQFSVSWLVDFQWGSCGSISTFLCHGWLAFRGVRVAQSLVFCVMVGRLLVGFVWLNLQFSVSWLEDFQWGSCGSIFSFLCHGWQTFSGVRMAQSLVLCFMVGRLLVGFVWLNLQFSVSWQVDFQWGSCDSIFGFLCHGWQTFSGLRVSQSLVFCVMVGRLLMVFVWLNLQFSVSWLVDFQWASCG